MERTHTTPSQEVILRELRAITGVTRAELAKRLGVQHASVLKLERRSDITLASLRRSGEIVSLLDAAEPKAK